MLLTTEYRPSPAKKGATRNWLMVGSNLDSRFGGISSTLPEFCRSVRQAGEFDISLAAFCHPDEEMRGLESEVKAYSRFPLGGMRNWFNEQIEAQLREMTMHSAGVHIHGLWQEHTFLAASEAMNAGRPYIISAHGMLDRWALRNKRLKKWIYSKLVENRNLRRAACLHALTRAEADDYTRVAPNTPVAVIPNGVTVPEHVDPRLFLELFPELKGKRLVLFLGRIHFKKGLDILCQAWREVSRKDPDLQLVIAGPDFENTRSKVESAIASLGIEKRVTFTGMLTGLEKWSAFAAAELFTLPSYSEGLSVAVLEAMGAGVPIVITRQCNLPEAAEAGCGAVIEPNAGELEQALNDVLRMPEERRRACGMNGRNLVRERFSWPEIGRQLSSVYEWLAGGNAPSAVDLRLPR